MRHTPQEIEVWYILPALRREFSKAFLVTGMKQKDIAKIMEITEPAVSQYLKAKRGKEVQFEAHTVAEIAESVKMLLESPSKFNEELQRVAKELRNSDFLCKIHQKFDTVKHECNVCRKKDEE